MATKQTKVEVTGETSKYERSMRNVKRVSQSTSNTVSSHWQKTAATIGKLTGLFGVTGAAGFIAIGKSAIDAGDQIHKLNLRLGISTEALSQYQHVADLSGITFETFTMGVQRMTRRVAEAAQGTGEARGALQELGLSAQYLTGLAPERQFELIAEAMMGVNNQSDKVRLAMKLFDSEGVSLLQTMNEGAAGIQKMREEADRLGLTLSKEGAQAMADANDAMSRIKNSMTGVTRSMVVELAPAIGNVADNMAEWIAQNRGLINQKTHEAINKITTATQTLVDIYESLPEGLVGATSYGIIGRILFGSSIGKLVFGLKMLAPYYEKLPQVLREYLELVGQGIPEGFFGEGETGGPVFRAPMPQYPETPKLDTSALLGGVTQAAMDSILANTRAYYDQMRGMLFSYHDEALAASQSRQEQELQWDQEKYSAQISAASEHFQAMKEMTNGNAEEIAAINNQIAMNEIAVARQVFYQKQAYKYAELNFLGAVGNAAIAMGTKQGKKQFAIQKSFDVAMAVISAFLGSAMARANPPGPPWTEPIAQWALKQGLMNAAAIAATSIGQIATYGGGGGGESTTTPAYQSTTYTYPEEKEQKITVIFKGEGNQEALIDFLMNEMVAGVEVRGAKLVATEVL